MTILYETMVPGTIVRGKWNGRQYRIEKLIGEGMNGKVYLVTAKNNRLAMKIGFDPVDLQSEVNVLRMLADAQSQFRSFLLDVDDLQLNGLEVPFYVMPYISGVNIQQFVEKRSTDWIYPIGSGLLQRLAELHRLGWAFGDLKPHNILISDSGTIRLIDYGGTTKAGRAVRQFTEIYDRGYWNAGTRTADAAYDLFSFSVLMIQLGDPQKRLHGGTAHLLPQHRNIEYLLDIVETSPPLLAVKAALRKTLLGQYASADEAGEDWRKAVQHLRVQPGSVRMPWLRPFFVASFFLFASVALITYIMNK